VGSSPRWTGAFQHGPELVHHSLADFTRGDTRTGASAVGAADQSSRRASRWFRPEFAIAAHLRHDLRFIPPFLRPRLRHSYTPVGICQGNVP
jgi:hypothetical protein